MLRGWSFVICAISSSWRRNKTSRRAAARLRVSQPPLSRQIQDLEEELGVELFHRTAKSLALTEAGKIFLNEAREVLLRADKAVEAVRAAAKSERGQLHVGYAPSLTVSFLPTALSAFEKTHPGIRVMLHDLSSEECLIRLASRKLDLALTVEPSKVRARKLTFEKLTTYAICCAVASTHALVQKKAVSLAQLRDETFVIYSQEDYPEYLEWIRRLILPRGYEPKIAGEYDGASGLITAVASGRGVAIVPSSWKCTAPPNVAVLPIMPKLTPVHVVAVHAKSPTPLVEKFVLAVKQAAGALK